MLSDLIVKQLALLSLVVLASMPLVLNRERKFLNSDATLLTRWRFPAVRFAFTKSICAQTTTFAY